MYVVKRNGNKESVHFDKILARIRKLSFELTVKPEIVAKKVIAGLYDGVSTRDLDTLAAETSAQMVLDHPNYGILAARIEISNLHKETEKRFSVVMEELYKNDIVTESFIESERKNANQLDSAIVHAKDYSYDYLGFKTLETHDIMRNNKKIVERQQNILIPVAGCNKGRRLGESIGYVRGDIQ